MKPNPTEKEFMEAVIELARLCGWMVYHTHDSRRSDPGFPDLVMLRYPSLIFSELKSENGRLTEHQLEWLSALDPPSYIERIAGEPPWLVRVWRPSDFDEIERCLK